MGKGKHFPAVDTAMHVLKGAVVTVLHLPVTNSAMMKNPTSGCLVVANPAKQQPTQEQVQEIQQLANEKISSKTPLEEIVMLRDEAEAKYTANPVNETYIYDSYGVPPNVKELTLTLIPDWNINCCQGPHVQPGELEGLTITAVKVIKKTLSISFNLRGEKNDGGPTVQVGGGSLKGERANGKGKQEAKSSQRPKNEKPSLSMRVGGLVDEVEKLRGIDDPEVRRQRIADVLFQSMRDCENAAYVEGYSARMAPEEERALFNSKRF
mmetsp:Transcript_12462/g.35199  ORF Transcript_12462/g.35199 Transcript_12462/m.35199 type:complete len:266 (+) Transcript_12462:154-951(+)